MQLCGDYGRPMRALLQDTYRAVDTDDESRASLASDVAGPLEPLLGLGPAPRGSVGDVCVAPLPPRPLVGPGPGVMPAQSVPSVASSALADGVIRRCHTVEEADSLSVCSRHLLPAITRERAAPDSDGPVRIDIDDDIDPTNRLIEAIENLRDSIHDNTVVQNRNKNPRSRRSTVGQMAGNQSSYKYDERLKIRNEKVMVEVRVVFLKVGEIDTLKEFYHADCFVQAKWREPKLESTAVEDFKNIDLDRYWSPLLFIDNILSETKDATWLVAQSNERGEVYIMERRRIKGVFLETLELNDFPLDVQDLTITITSERPDTEIDLVPDETEMSGINIQTFVDQQEWHLHEHIDVTKRVITQEFSSSMKSHPCMSVTCRAARRPGYFYWNVFLIMFMISGLSFATFAVGVDKPEYRLRLSFTLVLTSVTFKYVITQSLPKISYLTYMDKYVLMSLAILCIVSIWHAIVTLIPCELGSPVLTPVAFLRPSEPAPSLAGARGGPAPALSLSSLPSPPSALPSPVHPLPAASDLLSVAQPSAVPRPPPNASYASAGSNSSAESAPPRRTSDAAPAVGPAACRSHEFKKRIERDVFVSFCMLYILAHFIFILWLYFDASKRRREMRKRDREYKEWLEKKKEWQSKQKSKDQSNSRRQSGLLVHAV